MGIEQISPESDLDRFQREKNRRLMVAFAEDGGNDRAGLDLEKSVVLYTADKDFQYAMAESPTEKDEARLHEYAGVRFWSYGI